MPERLTGFLLRLLRLLLSFPHCEIHEQISELMVSTTLIGQKWKVIAESSSATWSPCLTRRNVGVSHFEVIRNSTYSAKPSASINLVDLFHNVTSLTSVSYGDLAELPRSFWEKVKYPDVYHTYPQDVPMKQIVKDIKAGLPVSDVG
ncbi:unnamed protein product [Mesocestoides corti]|uniref:Uncharacterized protein n=1 Tax=Mesocestoides corti TaxID=53468 RepID=A0A0R3UQ69_MESCO|nr:unnamed protein product [Mesocestoides corti]